MALSALIGALDVTGLEASGVQWSLDVFDGTGSPKPTINVIQKPRQSGGWAGTSYLGSRHLALSGQVSAPSQDLLTDAIDRLITAASLDLFTLTEIEGSRTRYYLARREDEVFFIYISDKMATWSVQFVAPDSRKFATSLVGTTNLPSSSGGLSWPNSWPQSWSAVTNTGTVSLTNPGNAAGPVMLRIDGPVVGPQIAHTSATNNSIITFAASLTLNAGEWLDINMTTRQVLANGQSSRATFITNRGWSSFDSGANTWSFSAQAYNSSALLTVTGTPAWS
jgi:hypothetical protein